MKFLILSIISSSFAFGLNTTYVKTNKFKVKTSKQYSRINNPKFCKFETIIKEDDNQVIIKAGVVGSPIDYFGWNMPINVQDLPLVDGFTKIYKTPGVTGMIMTYKDGLLTFKNVEDEQVWNRLYNFSVEINPSLTTPKKFKASLEGFERTAFGKLKKHVVQSCSFN